METTILDLLDNEYKHLKYDRTLAKKISIFRHEWATENEQHTLFLSGNSLGVQLIRFTSRHYNNFFMDILEKDASEIQSKIYSLDVINPKFSVSPDALNMSLTYLVRQFNINNNNMSVKDIEKVTTDIYFIFAYKITTSWSVNAFSTHPVDPQVMLTVYEKLSKKFILKRLGSWNKVYDYRSKDLKPKGIFYERILKFSDDEILQTINSIDNRLRSMLKTITNEIVIVTESKERVRSDTATMLDMDGEETLKDINSKLSKHINEVVGQIHDEGSFINTDLINLASKMVNNSRPDLLKSLIIHISSLEEKSNKINKVISEILLITTEMLNDKNTDVFDISTLDEAIVTVKNYWSSSNNFTKRQKEIIKIKKYLKDIIHKSKITRTKWVESSLRISFIIYLYLKLVLASK